MDIKDSDKEQAARAMFYKTSTFLYVEYIVRGDKKAIKRSETLFETREYLYIVLNRKASQIFLLSQTSETKVLERGTGRKGDVPRIIYVVVHLM